MAALTPPAFLQAGGETAAVTRLATGAGVLTSGIVGANDLLVSAPGGVMQVSVAAGTGWVVGSRAFQGAYHVTNDAPVTVTIASSDPTNPRYDRIVCEIKDAAYAGGVNAFQINVVQGTPGSSPAEPAIPADSFELVRILVPAASSTVVAGNLLDRRVRSVTRSAVFTPTVAADAAIVAKGTTAQAGSLYEGRDVNNTLLYSVDPSGNIYTAGNASVTGSLAANGTVNINGGLLNISPIADPSAPTSLHGYLYVSSTGQLKFRGGAGTITVVAPA